MEREKSTWRLSGHFGLGSFPLHTDLAHWAIPPRYLFLRCKVGTHDVFTELLHWSRVVDLVGKTTLQKAVFRSRKRRDGFSGLVRALSHHEQTELFRWDSLFLKPLNQHAEKLVSVMPELVSGGVATKVLLSEPGDAVLIDNWKMLHGRSAVPDPSKERHIERVYLTEVFQ
jgi:L-asparagine oxygenase